MTLKCAIDSNGLTLPENRNMCCFLIPIKIGVMVIALLTLLCGVESIIYLVNFFNDHKHFTGSAVGWVLCIVPLVIAAVLVV